MKDETLSDDYLKGWKDGKEEVTDSFRERVKKLKEEVDCRILYRAKNIEEVVDLVWVQNVIDKIFEESK